MFLAWILTLSLKCWKSNVLLQWVAGLHPAYSIFTFKMTQIPSFCLQNFSSQIFFFSQSLGLGHSDLMIWKILGNLQWMKTLLAWIWFLFCVVFLKTRVFLGFSLPEWSVYPFGGISGKPAIPWLCTATGWGEWNLKTPLKRYDFAVVVISQRRFQFSSFWVSESG